MGEGAVVDVVEPPTADDVLPSTSSEVVGGNDAPWPGIGDGGDG